jgi:hypothetical protein
MTTPEEDPDQSQVLSYESTVNRRVAPTLTQAMLLSLPGFMFCLLAIADAGGLIGGIGPCPILLLWLVALCTTFGTFWKYRAPHPKRWFVVFSLLVSGSVIGITIFIVGSAIVQSLR